MGQEGGENTHRLEESGRPAGAAGKVGEAPWGSISCVSQKRNRQPGAGFKLLKTESFYWSDGAMPPTLLGAFVCNSFRAAGAERRRELSGKSRSDL